MDCGVQGSPQMLAKAVYYNSDDPAAQGYESAEEDDGNQIDVMLRLLTGDTNHRRIGPH